MTGPAEHPNRRESDQRLVGRTLAWWRRWWQLITGIWLIAVSTGLFVLGLAFYQSQSQTEQAARVSCERTVMFGPELAEFYAREHVFSPEKQRQVLATIPKSCPTQ